MLRLREATREDVGLILRFIRELAEYEREPEAVEATEADLLRDGFGERPIYGCVLAEWDGEAAGFALYFTSYSTWKGRGGIHLEDIFVRPAMRGRGIGRALLRKVAAVAVQRGCGRMQLDVLEWNETAIGFYERMGAEMMGEWRLMRIKGEALARLAEGAE